MLRTPYQLFSHLNQSLALLQCYAPVQASSGRVQAGFPHPGHWRLQWSSMSDSQLSQPDQATSTPTLYEAPNVVGTWNRQVYMYNQKSNTLG